MPTFETPEISAPKAVPHYLLGAASPLWAYFATAAAGGVAFWMMTRWTRPVNLEALLEESSTPPAMLSEFAPATIEAVAEPTPEPELEAAPEPVAEIAPRARVKKPALTDEA